MGSFVLSTEGSHQLTWKLAAVTSSGLMVNPLGGVAGSSSSDEIEVTYAHSDFASSHLIVNCVSI